MLRMKNGDYVPKGSGLETVSGSEAVLQRVLLRLTARRGAFPFMESFGSRLWTLGQLKAAERQAAAEQYVAEALAEETDPNPVTEAVKEVYEEKVTYIRPTETND